MSVTKVVSIAIINPTEADGIARTVIDGCCTLAKEGLVEYRLAKPFNYPLPTGDYILAEDAFIAFANKADVILVMHSKRETDTSLVEKIALWEKTAFLDGWEVGGNNRYDSSIQSAILSGTYEGKGRINADMLSKCALYFRREKPYVKGILPLPFGIESGYVNEYAALTARGEKKDIDFFCVFGQDEYPPLRKYVREEMIRFCKKEHFSCMTEPMPREQFHATLARAKVGVSVGGGGFDTLRFWEILGANCLLMTETVDIYPKDSKALSFERISEFNSVFDFRELLSKVAMQLKAYNEEALVPEYSRILGGHSARSRVLSVLDAMGVKY